MDTLNTPFWGRKTVCLITGASQGIGRQIAVSFSEKVTEGSLLILLARSLPGLEETKDLIHKNNSLVNVDCHSVDLKNPVAKELARVVVDSMANHGATPASYDLAMIVHNAGTVGDVSEKTNEMSDPKKWADYLSLNFVSVTCLTSVFLQTFPEDAARERCVVNITSLCGIKPFKSMGYYCVGKASREMYFNVLAEEHPTLNVLSYSPGPVDTDMITEVIDNVGDTDVKEQFMTMKETTILTAEQTTNRFIEVLAGRKYKAGQHVDYFDP